MHINIYGIYKTYNKTFDFWNISATTSGRGGYFLHF